jgi:hypothetical protein
MLKKIFLFFILIISFSNLFVINNAFSTENYDNKVKSSNTTNSKINDHLDWLQTNTFINPNSTWAEWIKKLIISIAKDVKNIFYAVATIYFLIITIKLLFASNSEESFESYKKWLIWITIWIIVMQMSYAFVYSVFDKWVSSFAWSLISTVFIPIIQLLETMASVFFLLIAVYSFIRLLSSNWDKEKIKKWIDSIIYATIWIFLVILSTKIVTTIYWNYSISYSWSTSIEKESNFSSFINLFMSFINWVTWFVAIVTLIMIMYAWVNIIFANWDEEKIKKWRTTIIYAFIWIFILIISYLILTFFIWPGWTNIGNEA